MSQGILMVTGMDGADACAERLARELTLNVEVAPTRKAALLALRRREYSAVIVEDWLAESDPEGAELIWKHSALAVPLQVNFAISSIARLARDVRAALTRRSQEHELALRAAAGTLESELRSTVSGLVLHSHLALAEPSLSPQLAGHLKMIAELADALRRFLERPRGLAAGDS